MKRCLLLLFPIVLFSMGCIPQEKYDDLLTAYRAKERQNIQTLNGRCPFLVAPRWV